MSVSPRFVFVSSKDGPRETGDFKRYRAATAGRAAALVATPARVQSRQIPYTLSLGYNCWLLCWKPTLVEGVGARRYDFQGKNEKILRGDEPMNLIPQILVVEEWRWTPTPSSALLS